MNNSQNRWIFFLYLLIAFLLGISVAINFLPSKRISPTNNQLYKLNEVMNYIDRYYVDSVNIDSIYDAAIIAVMQGLDPHSSYSTQEQNQALMESLGGSFEGVGIQFNIMNDTVMVIATVSGGPSEKAGIRAGDRLVSVDGQSIVGATNDQVFKQLRGKKGTKVKIGVLRQGSNEVNTYEVKRDVIPTYTVDVSYMINDLTGYVKVNEFGSTTADEFTKALLKLKQMGMQSLIIDLRGNAGGYLDAAIQVCDELLPNKSEIVSIEGLKVRPEIYYATKKGNFEKGKVVILIDDFSASASEIVAGAVQDNDRGYIVGRRSFGKGLVQRQFDLSDKSTIRLTTARYHTPSGRCIQRDYKEGTVAYYEELYKRIENGELEYADSIKLDKSVSYKTIGGRTVYGGGGIMPDYFVPVEKNEELQGYYEVANSAALIQYAFHYVNNRKASLQKTYPNVKTFLDKYTVSDFQLNELLDYYTNLTQKNTPTLAPDSKKELKIWIKALIGRNLYGEEAFYPVINLSDKTIKKAMEVLENEQEIK